MAKYRIELTTSEVNYVDVEADNEDEAIDKSNQIDLNDWTLVSIETNWVEVTNLSAEDS